MGIESQEVTGEGQRRGQAPFFAGMFALSLKSDNDKKTFLTLPSCPPTRLPH